MTAFLALLPFLAFAQSTPVGLWRNVDDHTGEVKAEIRITEGADGALTGRIEKVLAKAARPDDKCVKCEGDRKDQPMVGLEIIRGARKSADGNAWEGGRVLDPENGREYRLKLTPMDGGSKLDVRGYVGPFSRGQTWQRAQ